nr:capsid protein [Sarcosphaera coronaria partitivirus]
MGKSSRSTQSKTGHRDYDAESGKKRTGKGKQPKQEIPEDEDHQEEFEESNDELDEQEEEQTPRADPNRRKKSVATKSSRPTKRNQKPTTEAEVIEQDISEDETFTAGSTTVNAMLILASRMSIVTFHTEGRSYYIPDYSAYFSITKSIGDLLFDNSLTHHDCPEFTSLALNVHSAYTIFYHYLRVRETAGELNREERRTLRRLTNAVKPESWTVLSPFTHHLTTYGIVELSGYYKPVVPKMPNFTELTAVTAGGATLTGLASMHGSARIPMVPAMVEFLSKYGNGTTSFSDDGVLHPATDQELDAQDTFLGLTAGKATDRAQALFLNGCWTQPAESEYIPDTGSHDLKRNRVKRWNLPTIIATQDLTSIEKYLLLQETNKITWLASLNAMVSKLTKYFPGSVNLGSIVHTTQPEIITPFILKAKTQRVFKDDVWYRGRSEWTLSALVNDATPTTLNLVKLGSVSAPNGTRDATLMPAMAGAITPANMYSPVREGPYFIQGVVPTNVNSLPQTRGEMCDLPDPLNDLQQVIEMNLYDKLGGRSSR